MPTPRPAAPPTGDIRALAAGFLVSGLVHLLRPQVFEPIIPRALPAPRALVYASGLAELACGAGLLHPRSRRLAGLASAALLVAVFPANVQMSADQGQRARRCGGVGAHAAFAATLARLPMQWPMIRVGLKATRV